MVNHKSIELIGINGQIYTEPVASLRAKEIWGANSQQPLIKYKFYYVSEGS